MFPKVWIFVLSLFWCFLCFADNKENGTSTAIKSDASPLLYSCVKCHGVKDTFPIFENNKIKSNYNKSGLLHAIDLILADRVFDYHSIRNQPFAIRRDLETARNVLEEQTYKKSH